ncbi:hypothetical protein [Glutamicibacter soli]|nr:hypothetical protein [Glutamicibacter soli]
MAQTYVEGLNMIQHTQSQLVASLSQYTDSQIARELLRRAEEREHLEATAKAVEILREIPEALSPKWTVNKLCNLAIAHGLPASAAFAAWEELTASTSDARISNATLPGGFTVGQRVRNIKSGAEYTVTGAGILTNHVSVQLDAPDADGCMKDEFYASFLEPVNADA